MFLENHATSTGGAVLCGALSTPAFTDCAFIGNEGATGGAVSCGGFCNPAFVRCQFTGNSASDELTGRGGAVQCMHHSSPAFDYCTFDGNTAAQSGGVIYCYSSSSPLFTNCSLVGNGAPDGGALYCWDNCFPELHNSLIVLGTEGGATFSCDDSCGPLLECCDVYGNVGGDWLGWIADQFGVNGNISADPLFCDPGVGDLSLHIDSPCLPGHNPECGLIGAWPVGCPSSGVADGIVGGIPDLRLSPNPFTRTTHVTYSIPATRCSEYVTLSVHDTAGRLLRVLVDGPQPPGSHTVSWNGADGVGRPVGAGIYFYRLDLGSEGIARRVVLLR